MDVEFYKQVIEESPNGYAYHRIILDKNGKPCDYIFLEVNQAFENLTGLKRSEIAGMRVSEIIQDIGSSEFNWIEFYGDVALGGSSNEFEQYSAALGKWYRVKVYAPQTLYFVTHFTDITHEKRQIQEVQELYQTVIKTENLYRMVADCSSDWDAWEDETGQLRYVSPACEDISGYSASEFIDNENLFESLIIEEDFNKWIGKNCECENININSSIELRIKTRSGQIIWIEHFSRAIENETEEFLGYRINIRNITRRKQAEENLSESKAFLSNLLDSIPTPIFFKDNRGKYLGFNNAYEHFFGKTREDLIGKSVFDINPEHLARIYHDKDAVLFEKVGIQIYESQVKDAIGQLHDVIFHKATMTNSKGEISGLIGTILDITERKKAEDALKASQRQLSDIIDFLPDAALAVNKERQIIIWNKAIEKMTGIPASEMMGRGQYQYTIPFYGIARPNLLDLIFNDDESIRSQYNDLTIDGETMRTEIYCPAIFGKRGAWIVAKASPLHDQNGDIVGAIEILRDTTERKSMETALAEEKNLLKTTLISVGDGVISTDIDGKIVLINKTAETLTGWSNKNVKGKPIEDIFNIVDSFSHEKCENIVKKVIQTGMRQELSANTLLVSKNGITRPIEDSAAPIIDDLNKIVGVVLVFRDVSDQRAQREKIEYLSFHDPLTGLYNRRFFEEEMNRIDTRRNLPLTIIMGDVNGLKLTNDVFGHASGDKLLMTISEVFRRFCRADDIIARWGGDEFVLLLPRTESGKAEEIVRRIKEGFAKEKILAIQGSISMGLDCKINESEDIRIVLSNAEERMYVAKTLERDAVRNRSFESIIKTYHENHIKERGHSNRVSELCQIICESLDISTVDTRKIRQAGYLHDIGKIVLDPELLDDDHLLTEDEWNEVKRHPILGYRILNYFDDTMDLSEIVLAHHERWDGKGYPKGICGNEIPLAAQVISIAESFDRMTHSSIKSKIKSVDAAIQDILENAGSQFDPKIAGVFAKAIKNTN